MARGNNYVNPPKGTVSANHRHKRALEWIGLLCQTGTGLPAMAGSLCAALRQLLDCDAGSLFWFDEMGNPSGFFHETAPADLKDHYVNNLPNFVGGPVIDIIELTRPIEPAIGRMLEPGMLEQFWTENIYRYLASPLGHRYLLDMRLESADRSFVSLYGAWNTEAHPFGPDDVAKLALPRDYIQAMLNGAPMDPRWRGVGDGTDHLITNADGSALIAISPGAECMLMDSHLLMQDVPMASAPRMVPSFVRQLSRQSTDGAARIALPAANGRIIASARPTRMIGADTAGCDALFVALVHEVSIAVEAANWLMAAALTPMQRKIALFAIQGGERSACEQKFGVSSEALKKHVRAILDVTECERWHDLQDRADRLFPRA